MINYLKKAILPVTAMFLFAGFKPYPGNGPKPPDPQEDKTLSPYFFVKSDDPSTDKLPLKSTSAQIKVAGVIADVKVTQVYKNEGKNPLEAIYIFPASTRAAVYAMQMTIGKRTIKAKINEREQARKEYEQAKQEGKSASLLEQQRPNVFQMNVANILPGDTIKVEMSYTELLVPTDGIYEIVYPTVVGPRYSNVKEGDVPKSENWVKNPYLHEGENPPYEFDISASISAGLPISEVACTTHKTSITYDGKADAVIKLDPGEKHGGNRDFIVRYSLSGKEIESGILLYKGKDENFFLAMVEPPKKVAPKDIPPREYIFIVDVSGSMRGFPLDISKTLLSDLIGGLRPTDVFNVMLFESSSRAMAEKSLPASPENIKKAIEVIDNQRGGGGTEILQALKSALALPKTEGTSRTFLIITDGYVRVETEAFDLIRNNLGQANMFAFGIGSSVNRHIIEGMARVGMGEPFVVTKPDEAPGISAKFRKIIESPVLTSVKIDYGKFKVYDVEPLSVPDVMAQKPVIVFGKWKGEPKGVIGLSGISGSKKYSTKIDLAAFPPKEENSPLRYLWARHRIAVLSDYNNLQESDARVKEVTNLGLTYSLLTAYTSFVAIDSEIRLKDGKATTVTVPAPMPQGVSDYALGAPTGLRKSGFMKSALAPHEESGRAVYDAVSKATYESPVIETLVSDITASGQIKKADINNALISIIPYLERCYKDGISAYPEGGALLKIEVVVNRDGKVKSVKTLKNNSRNNTLNSCIEKKIGELNFPKPQDGKDSTVTFNLKFTVKKKGK